MFGVYDLSHTPSAQGARPTDVPDMLDPPSPERGGMLELYLPGRTLIEAREPEYSPLYARLGSMPPALFTVGTVDHLLDDSLFMANRWAAWGNQADLAVYPDCPHGFVGFGTELARIANERMAAFIDTCLPPAATAG